mgnify:CR=1 FL=1
MLLPSALSHAACPLREACGATGGECSAYANISLALSLSDALSLWKQNLDKLGYAKAQQVTF